MTAATILMTYAETGDDISVWVLCGIKFIYCGKHWKIYIGKRVYEVTDVSAGQIAYALTVNADIAKIKESLREDEVDESEKFEEVEEPEEVLIIADDDELEYDEWQAKQSRKNLVKNLVNKIRVSSSSWLGSDY